MKIALWVVGAFVAFLVIGNLLPDPSNDPKWMDREAISLCWKEQGRKSNSAGQAQFQAGACEMMEDRFTKTYGVKP